jgi:hypothetical protein
MHYLVGFEVLTVVSMNMAVFWVVVPCSLVEVYQRFRGPVLITLMMKAARTSETLVNFYQTTQCYNPEDSHLHVLFNLTVERAPINQWLENWVDNGSSAECDEVKNP